MKSEAPFDAATLIAGNAAAWRAFIARYGGVVHAAVGGVLRGAGRESLDSMDLAQDVFLRLCKEDYRLLRQYDPARASIVTWLTIVARSVAMDALRRKVLPRVAIEDVAEAALSVAAVEPVDKIKIPAGLLSPRQELVMTLLYDRDLDPAEAAAVLGIDAQTVRSMHHKALVKLRAHFKDRDVA